MFNLSNDQLNIINNLITFNDWTLIDSIAGSGKTSTICFMIHYLLNMYNIDPNSIIVLTFTKNVAIQMKYKIKKLTNINLLNIGTIHSIAYNYIKTDNNFYYPCEIIANFHKLINDSNEFTFIKYIFIDEYQDLDEKQLQLIDLLKKKSDCKVIFVGDIDQSIYSFRNQNINYEYFNKCDKYLISYNYRNTANIISLANKLLNLKNDNKKIIKGTIIEHNEPIKIIGCNTLIDEFNQIIKIIDKIINKKILILSRYNYPIKILEGILIKNKIDFNNLEDNKFIYHEKIAISTIHGAKGLEADYVFLINAGNIDIDSESEFTNYNYNEEINLLYVAITRAKFNLCITYHYKINNILNKIIDNIEHKLPDEIIKPKIYYKNNYYKQSVTEKVKNLTLSEIENIKKQYKITFVKTKVHRSFEEITNKKTLNVIDFLNDRISGTLPILGNYIDHYIGYVVDKKYHPDLEHIKVINYINNDIELYQLIYKLNNNNKLNEYISDIKNNIDIKDKYQEIKSTEKLNNKLINISEKINLLDFLQRSNNRIKLSDEIKNYLTYNEKTIKHENFNVVLKTIFINSLLTSIIQGKTSYEHLLNSIKVVMFNDELEKEWFNEIKNYVIEKKYDIYQKPLHGICMNGIIDLFNSQDKYITDIKCSYNEFIPGQYIIQLLYYYLLCIELGIETINKHKLYLPLKGIEIVYTFEKI